MTRTDRLFMSISHTSSSYNRGSCRHGQRCVSPCRNRGEVCVRKVKRAWRLGSNFRGFSSGGSRVKSKSVRLPPRVKNTHSEFIILIIQNSTHTIINSFESVSVIRWWSRLPPPGTRGPYLMRTCHVSESVLSHATTLM